MKTLKNNEGYVMIDHRQSPGVPDRRGMPVGFGKGLFETSSYTCHHCQRVVLNDPSPFRRADRPFCGGCNHHICAQCKVVMTATGVCKPFSKVIEEVLNAVAHGRPIPHF